MRSLLCATLLIAFVCISTNAFSQQIQVNPDGSHTIIQTNGNTSTIVNPDGSHSTKHSHGNNSIIVNPDGSHTTQQNNNIQNNNVNAENSQVLLSSAQDTIKDKYNDSIEFENVEKAVPKWWHKALEYLIYIGGIILAYYLAQEGLG